MKKMKKLASLVLALAMALTLAVPAMAAGNGTITITEAVKDETYEIYKLFDLVVDSEANPTAYAYTINKDWKAFFTGTGAGSAYVTMDGIYVTAILDKDGKKTNDAADLAAAAAAWASKPAALDTVVAANNTVVFDDLENGYYLITSTLGTIAMAETTPDKDDVTIKEKNPEDTIKKEVKEDSTKTFGEKNDAQVGDTVEFKSEAKLYPHTRNVKIHDTMTSGLTYNGDVKIYTSYNAETKAFSNELDGKHYTIQAAPDAGDTFTISFDQAYLDNLPGETILYLNYTATLNENAVVKNENGVAIVDQYNDTTITYGDKQSVPAQTKTTTHKSAVNKYGDKIDNLAGAVFSLKKDGVVVPLVQLDDLNYRVATAEEIAEAGKTTNTFETVDTGDIVIWGLDTDNDYTLFEEEAPDGYNKLTQEIGLKVNADNSSVNDVLNQTGTELPSTGGMGTTLFYALGAVLVIGAGVAMVTKKRMA